MVVSSCLNTIELNKLIYDGNYKRIYAVNTYLYSPFL